MSTQGFQLDSSLAGLSPALLRKRYDQLTPEERRQLGFTRLATDQEAASPQQGPGAPADFGGMVLPNPNGIQVSPDTASGVSPTRLPNGVTFQKQNFSGPMPGDVSNPPHAALAGQTVGANFSGKLPPGATIEQDTGPKLPAGAVLETGAPIAKTKTQSGFWDDPKAYLQNRAKDLQGEAQRQTNLAMGVESEGKPFYERLGHRLLSLAPETAAVVDKMVAGGMDWKNAIAIAAGAVDPAIPAAYFGGHGAAQLTGIEPGVNAGDVSPENVQNALLAGSAVAGGAAAGQAPRAGSTVDLIKAGAEKAGKLTPKQAAQVVGGASGAVAGHGTLSAPGAYYGAKTAGNIAEGVLGKERANAPILRPKPGATATAAGEEVPTEAAPGQSAAEAMPAETPAQVLQKPGTPAELEKALNEALGGKPLQRGVSLRNQGQATGEATAGNLPEGFTPVQSSALKGYKYDPAAREFESITQGGQHYVHGDVSPEDAQAFEAAESKGKAWQQIRNNPLVAKVVNGERLSVKPAGLETSTGEVIPKSQAGMGSLEEQLQQSLEQAQSTKGLKPGTPRFVYRARDVGEEGIPVDTRSHAQATSEPLQALRYAEPGQRGTAQGQVVRIDLSKLKSSDYVVETHPDGMKWVRFTRPLAEDEVSHFAGAGQPAGKLD